MAGTAETTGYWYDANGNMAALADPAGNQTTWQYDALNRVIEKTDQLGNSDYYSYNGAGELADQTDGDGRVTSYSYDAIGRVTAENWYDAGSNLTETIAYVYNSAGWLESASDYNVAAGTTATDTYTYDLAGEVTSETQEIPGLDPVVTLNAQYTGGNRTQLAAAIGETNDFVNNYQYEGIWGQMSQVTQTGNSGNAVAAKTATFAYDRLGEFSGVGRYQYAGTSANAGRPGNVHLRPAWAR